MNYIKSGLPPASSRRHLGHINGIGLTDTTYASLKGGGGDVCKRGLPSVGRTDRDSGAAESELREGGRVKIHHQDATWYRLMAQDY